MEKTALKTFIVALLFGLCALAFFRLGELETTKDELLRGEEDFFPLVAIHSLGINGTMPVGYRY
jgi:hypothetical protein